MRIKRTFSIFIIFFISVFSLNAGENISLSTALDKVDIRFEETVDLRLEIKWQGDITSYAFEVIPLPDLENLKVLGTSTAVSSSVENGIEYTTRTQEYTLQPTSSGIGTINPITLQCISMPDSIPAELSTQLLKVNIAKPIPAKKKSGVPIYLYLAIAALMIATVVIVVFRKKNKPVVEPVKSPEENFCDALAIIKSENQSDRKLFFTKLYSALIELIKSKYKIDTTGQNAEVISGLIDNLEIAPNEKEKISGWLIKAEKEKYAPFGGEPGDIIRLITELENYFGSIKTDAKSKKIMILTYRRRNEQRY